VNIAADVGGLGYVGFSGGTGGLTTVADVQTWTYSFTQPEPQRAPGGPAVKGGVPALTAAELAPVAQQAVANWAATGLSPAQVAQLQAVQYRISPLNDGVLGLTVLGSSLVTLDATAAGYGWFVDSTPASDGAFERVVAAQELQAGPDSPAFGRMDLLTVVEHELGHVLGLGDLDSDAVPHDLLTTTLAPSVRRLLTPALETVAAAVEPAAPPAPFALQAPAAPVVVQVEPAPTAVETQAVDASPAAGDRVEDSPGPAAVGEVQHDWLLADLALALPAAATFAPRPGESAVAGGPTVAYPPVPPAAETGWLSAAVLTGADHSNNASDAFFAQLGALKGLLDLLGGDPGELL
jgi:hypothetical protein